MRFVLALFFAVVLLFPEESMAQNVGDPVVKKAFFYTIGGGIAVTAIGAAWWLTDPLNPSTDFRQIAMSSFALGSLIGLVYGVQVLANDVKRAPQTLQPQQPQEEVLDEDIYGGYHNSGETHRNLFLKYTQPEEYAQQARQSNAEALQIGFSAKF